jgi:hypothetical protein
MLLNLLFSNLTSSGMPKMYDCIGYNVAVIVQILAITETLHGIANFNFALESNAVLVNNTKNQLLGIIDKNTSYMGQYKSMPVTGNNGKIPDSGDNIRST